MTAMHSIILATLAAVTTAMPSYIAVPALPADQIAFVDLRDLKIRVPRQTLTPPPLPNHQLPQLYNQDFQPILQQYQRQPVALNPEPEAPVRLAQIQSQDASEAGNLGAASQYADRPPDFGEYVDFGAHTGDNGAFGWYADYPINNHQDNSGY